MDQSKLVFHWKCSPEISFLMRYSLTLSAVGLWIYDTMFGRGGNNSEITIECGAENEHSRVAFEVWEESEDNGNKDSSNEE